MDGHEVQPPRHRIGPIETYEDGPFGDKAVYGAFVLVKDMAWSERLSRFAAFLPDLQRGYLERMQYLMGESPTVPVSARSFVTAVNVPQSDIRPHVRGELEPLKREIRAALDRGPDRATRLHLLDAQARIEDIPNPRD